MTQQVPWGQTSQAWDGVAEGYESVSLKFSPFYAKEACRLLGLKAGDTVLDIAAGTGAFTFLAAQLGANVFATDYSPGMVERLQMRATREGYPSVRSAVMDGEQLDVPDNTFDIVCSVFGVMLFPNRIQGFSEMYRVLRPGGRAAAVAWGRQERVGQYRLLAKAREVVMPGTTPRPSAALSLQDPEVFQNEMMAAGFKDVRVHTLAHKWEASSAQELWNEFSSFSPTVAAMKDTLGQEKALALQGAFVRLLSQEYGEGSLALEIEANIGVGYK